MKFEDLISKLVEKAHKEGIPFVLIRKLNKKWKVAYNHNVFEKDELRTEILNHLKIKGTKNDN
ncbi:MAG: hypothetical protein PHS54_02985 [Clostridia bacterium]|nr:hypothetical protein [Clostridia bacterium]